MAAAVGAGGDGELRVEAAVALGSWCCHRCVFFMFLVKCFASVAAAAGAGGDGELRAEAAVALGELVSSQVRWLL